MRRNQHRSIFPGLLRTSPTGKCEVQLCWMDAHERFTALVANTAGSFLGPEQTSRGTSKQSTSTSDTSAPLRTATRFSLVDQRGKYICDGFTAWGCSNAVKGALSHLCFVASETHTRRNSTLIHKSNLKRARFGDVGGTEGVVINI
jgi:hypothetical protein